jgi:hypothetical protein
VSPTDLTLRSALLEKIQEVGRDTLGAFLKLPARLWREVFDGILAYDDHHEIARITAATLLIWGERDALLPRAHQDALAAAITGSRLTIYPDIGHCPNVNPIAAVRTFGVAEPPLVEYDCVNRRRQFFEDPAETKPGIEGRRWDVSICVELYFAEDPESIGRCGSHDRIAIRQPLLVLCYRVRPTVR